MTATLVEQACHRAAALVRQDCQRGQAILATITATAPLLGFLLASRQIAAIFSRGVSGDKASLLFYLAAPVAEAWIPAAFGLALGIAAHAQYRARQTRLEATEIEMRAATQILVAWTAHDARR
ncbi:MAG: hypothetical protein FJW31_26230 [Acidobacteria bacterium]|nr:hypothetical protein [Acidobacteriota bacterium]